MIGKITAGSGFKGVVNYVLGKAEARLIASDGVLTDSPESIARSFITQSLLRPNLQKPVKHISLSYKKEDAAVLTDEKMVGLAKEYLERMNLGGTQYIIVRHNDREHPHCHIVLNRIDNEGNTLSDNNERLRNMTVCRELKEKHGLTFAKDKKNVDMKRLREPERVRHEIYHALEEALQRAKNWGELRSELQKKGIRITFKYKGRTSEIQGIRFEKDKHTFKGSQIDRNCSYSRLDERLSRNNKQVSEKIQPKQFPVPHDNILFPEFGFSSSEVAEKPDDSLIREAEWFQRKKKKKKGLKL